MAETGSGYFEETHTLQASSEDLPLEVTVSGAELATTALILVHGFGVRRDSRGLFTEIADATQDKVLTIRGDYSAVDGDTTTVVPFSKQVARLDAIRNFCRDELATHNEVLIGHSQGWLPIALSYPSETNIVALAPPLGNAFKAFIQTSGWTKRGSELNLKGESRLIRSDGSLTIVPEEFWGEFHALGDVSRLMVNLTLTNKFHVIFAGEDNVLGSQEAPATVHTETIPGANHDFTENTRSLVVTMVANSLNQL